MIDETSEFDQLMDGHAIPVVEVFGLLLALYEFEFLFWIIDEGAKFALVTVAHSHTEDVDDFAAYLSGSVAQHVIESVGFAMDIAQEVLGTLREAHYGLQIDDLGRDTVNGREFFTQELKNRFQISTLCIKSGNCAILKGGRETARTNRVLFSIIHDAAVSAGLPDSCLVQAELHNEIDELLQCEKDVDLLIPRGSNQFVQYIMNNTKIPVMGHADGICHIYVDRDVDEEMAVQVIIDAKTQYTAACNAVETILVHREIAPVFLPRLARSLARAGVRLRGTQEAENLIARSSDTAAEINAIDIMSEDDFRTEYLDMIVSLKVVADVEEAIDHINRYGSHHTDSILTRDDAAAERFLQMVDSAGVYRNCSTRFADGFRYGFGAEVGISTSKLHARGPVGVEGLVTYKYTLRGNGQIVGDYASGRSQFHFRDL